MDHLLRFLLHVATKFDLFARIIALLLSSPPPLYLVVVRFLLILLVSAHQSNGLVA